MKDQAKFDVSTTLIVLIGLGATFGTIQSYAAKILGTISVESKSKKDSPALAKISLQDAVGFATKAHPGKVTEVVLEREDGFLVYEIEITDQNQKHKKVLIDAGTGKVLAAKARTSKHDDDDEDEND